MPEQPNQAEHSYQLETLAVHAGTKRSQFNEHSEAMFLTSSFVFDSAAQAAARFIGAEPGNIYSRFTNPTVAMFEERLAALEGAGLIAWHLVATPRSHGSRLRLPLHRFRTQHQGHLDPSQSDE